MALWAAAHAWGAEVPAASPASPQVLFLGNSYTYVNDLPGKLRFRLPGMQKSFMPNYLFSHFAVMSTEARVVSQSMRNVQPLLDLS